ncbi:hypothetical protein B4Q13_20905, partial [Lacticaseibacillus rhamnosus]
RDARRRRPTGRRRAHLVMGSACASEDVIIFGAGLKGVFTPNRLLCHWSSKHPLVDPPTNASGSIEFLNLFWDSRYWVRRPKSTDSQVWWNGWLCRSVKCETSRTQSGNPKERIPIYPRDALASAQLGRSTNEMHSPVLVLRKIAWAGALLFFVHRRRAMRWRNLEIIRSRILSVCYTNEQTVDQEQKNLRATNLRQNWVRR